MKVTELASLQISLASPEEILEWSHGEVLKPETINYRTLKPEKDGLFCERIFGPTTDFQCYCGKYRRIRYKGIICDRCGVEVTKSAVRRERMGHIKLATPCAHIWFLRGIPSSIGQVLDISREKLERVVYFAAYIITMVNEEGKQRASAAVDKEYKIKVKSEKAKIKNNTELNNVLKKLKEAKDRALNDLNRIQVLEVLSEIDYQEFSFRYGEVFEAKTGTEALYEVFKKIDLKKEIKAIEAELEKAPASARRKIMRRLRFFQDMEEAKIRPEWMFLTILPVLPPDLRPMVQLDGGRYASSDLNDLYRRVINRNNRLKYLLEIAAPEVIVRNEKRMLQESIDALIDNGMRTATMTRASSGGRRLLKSLADMLKGKKGRFRRNLLGKRVDYSGRSVIVVGADLSLHQVGLPKQMALELFKPFVIKEILKKELAYNVRGASRLIEQETDEVWAILENVVKDKLVLLNRAPTLHRLGIQAFQPVLIEGLAIQLHPLTCSAFNADFDGDQMAVHLPLSEEAQAEAREIMLSSLNLLKPATGRPVVSPSQDIILGAYLLSRIKQGAKGEGRVFSGSAEALMAYQLGEIDLGAQIKVLGPLKGKAGKPEIIETSVGRIIFNQVLPDDFEFFNELLNSKKLEKISWEVIEKYGGEKAPVILDKIKELGFTYSTKSGLSLSIDDFRVPAEKKEIIEKAEKETEEIRSLFKKGFLTEAERAEQIVGIWSEVKKKIGKLLSEGLPQDGPVFTIADSGCRGSWVQPIQIAGMKGLVLNPLGQVIELPVKSSYKEGLGVLEYFISTHGARKGTADTALGTSKAGYLTRRLVDVAHELIITELDCQDKKGTEFLLKDAVELAQGFGFKIVGRVSLEDVKDKNGKVFIKKGEIINWQQAEKAVSNEIASIRVRSPLSCQTLGGVCQQCYGWDLGRNQPVRLGEAVGVVAAQAIGEPGTQLTLRTFHTGGVAGGGDITVGLPRVDEVLEGRIPKGEAVIALADAEVLEVKERTIKVKNLNGEKSKKKSAKNKTKKEETMVYRVPEGFGIWVKPGEKVKAGQPLSEGSLRLQTLSKLTDKITVQKYIVHEVQRIYVSQGVRIHDKHVEVIARQMFSRMRIRTVGDSQFSPGQIVEASKFLRVNEELKAKNKKLATAREIVLGISKVALTTDSFLSAASFQHTSRILIEAALKGEEDHLRGLKENVIIGKLIPAGTGFKKTKN